MNIDEIKQLLLEEISKTELLIKEYQEITKPVAPDVAIGRISRMDAINNKSVTEASLRHSESKLINTKTIFLNLFEKIKNKVVEHSLKATRKDSCGSHGFTHKL